jgi:MoxR-like ATPase
MSTDAKKRSLSGQIKQLRSRLAEVVRGKQDVIDLLTTALVAGGSVLLEDVPGVGKTTLAKSLAASIELSFQRVQCTPDLLPADIFGFSIFNPQDGSFRFTPGPIFCNVLLVDEINRASPRTQSALLEAMAEGQVTIEGAHHPLSPPFMVLATQNPVGSRGTFALPESQLDRFLFQLSVGYPDQANELEMLYDHTVASYGHIEPSLTKDELLSCQEDVRRVKVERSVGEYLIEIVRRTRENPRIRIGVSPRGALMLFRAAQAVAFLDGREFVIPDDIQRIAPVVLHHRIVPAKASEATSAAQREIIHEILPQVRIPV